MARRLGPLLLLLCAAGSVAAATRPDLALARPFEHHMVLPRDVPVPIRGTAPPHADVTVRFGATTATTRSDADGRWRVSLDPLTTRATPGSLVVTASDQTVRLLDVVVGDVWLCAGQSNMDFPLHRARNADEATADSTRPDLRLLDLTGRLSPDGRRHPLDLLRSITAADFYRSEGWRESGPDSARGFSAVGWFCGARLQDELGVPIGLIDVSVGGSPVEAWTPRSALERDPTLRPRLDDWLDDPAYPAWCRLRARQNLGPWLKDPTGSTPHHPFEPGFLFEAAIGSLAPFPIRGVLWYQGESNATVDGSLGAPVDPAVNDRKLRALISGWREAWGRPELPFLMVQLPGLDREWPPFRDVQRRVARDLPQVGLIVTIDAGHATDVHPPRKRPVGERLARLALSLVHGRDDAPTGPDHRSHELDPATSTLLLRFDHAAGLRTRDGEPPVGFAVAGEDRAFHPAEARITGEGVKVRSDAVAAPVAVRYAWENDPLTNLENVDGLPAAPFRTDDWPVRPKLRVACIGDGITFGSGIHDRRRRAWPAVLERLLGPDFATRNFGRPGAGVVRRSMRGAERRAFLLHREHRRALAWSPNVVVCNLGINDLMDWERYGRTDFVEDYRALLAEYRALPSRPTLLLWSPLAPLFAGHRFHGHAFVAEIEAAIAAVADEVGARTIDVRAPLEAHREWFPDSIHPDAEGARAIAERVAEAIRALER